MQRDNLMVLLPIKMKTESAMHFMFAMKHSSFLKKTVFAFGIVVGSAAFAVLLNSSIPTAQAQETPEQTRAKQIAKLTGVANQVAESYVKDWSAQNAPATTQVAKLYQALMVKVVGEVLADSIKKPLTAKQMADLENSLKSFVAQQYESWLLYRPQPKMTASEVDDKEYYSQRILDRWEKTGAALTRQNWKFGLQYQLLVFGAVALTEPQKKQIKADAVALVDFVDQEIKKRWPNVPPAQLKEARDSALAESLEMMEDATIPLFKKPLQREQWPTAVEELFKRDEQLTQLFQEKSPFALSTVYSLLWGSLVGTSMIEVDLTTLEEPADIGAKVVNYLSGIMNSEDHIAHRVVQTNPIYTQNLIQQETTFWLFSFGNEIDARR